MECTLQEPKILVLDNDQTFLAQCQNELRKHGMLPVADKPGAAATVTSQIDQYKPDVILADLYIGKMDSAQFIREMQRQIGGNTPHFIILSSYKDRNLFQECCEAGAAYCMIKPIDFTILSERINRVCAQPKESVAAQDNTSPPMFHQNNPTAQATNILRRIGIPAHIKGYSYLRFAIITAVHDPQVLNLVTKILYPAIAHEFGTTASRVERSIRHAIEVAWDRGNIEAQQELFGYNAQSKRGKPTNSEFIALAADKLQVQNLSVEHANLRL